jgi:hypothetical protein
MKRIRHSKLLTLISIIVLSCNAQSASAQARISASATFINGTSTTITGGSTTTTDSTTGIITTVVPSTAQTLTTTGAITTVSAESSLPTGFYYASTTTTLSGGTTTTSPAYVIVVPQYNTLTSSGTPTVVESLSLGAGPITPVGTGASFTQAAAQILLTVADGTSPLLTTAGGIDAAAALIKAGAGVAGLE